MREMRVMMIIVRIVKGILVECCIVLFVRKVFGWF